MDRSDPISDTSTPNKRRKLNSQGQPWEDDEDEWTAEDFEGGTATLPLPEIQKRKLQYPASTFHSNVDTMTSKGSPQAQRTYQITQPTQSLRHITQPTQPLPRKTTPPAAQAQAQVQVERSSPAGSSPIPTKPVPQRAPFAHPRVNGYRIPGLAVGPAGTQFRQPFGAQQRPRPIPVNDDDESDPPVDHGSDDDETQGLRSNIKPTNFKKGGRGLDSTPNRSDHFVKESPRASAPGVNGGTAFSNLMSSFAHSESAPRRPSDDMASAYGSTSRAPRPQQRQTAPSRAQPVTARPYETLDEVPDFQLRARIGRMRSTLGDRWSIQQCYDVLVRVKGNEQHAMTMLIEMEERADQQHDDADELGTMSPVVKRGVAVSSSSQVPKRSSQPIRPVAKQEVKATSKSIAEKYAQPAKSIAEKYSARKPTSQAQVIDIAESDEDEIKPKRRLLKGRKPARSPTPPSSPPKLVHRTQKKPIVIDSGDEGSDVADEVEEEEAQADDSPSDVRLLKFFNECSERDLVDLTAQPEAMIKLIIDARPFESLDAVRVVSATTKGGKPSKTRPVGDKIVEICSEMWQGYDAVDELVDKCAEIAKPIQQALKGWGVGEGESELHMMTLDEAHDSGIGTPVSSLSDDATVTAPQKSKKSKGRFLSQPENMSQDVTLKNYQLVGLNWLNLLWSQKLSCILADDMGLGKTCQVIAFLAHLQGQNMEKVHIVIVPGSTLENWLREFARFAPSLRVVPYYGSQNERPELQVQIDEDFENIDVIVTTYDMAVKKDDNKFLRKLGCAVCVFDEAHALRNPKSDRYEQLMRIGADFRLLLTGTPLQNNLQELVAILAFIMPDLFQGKREELEFIFKHKASTKDADHAALLSAERIARARTMMTPFILRRKKAQVLDLPAKHSRVELCDPIPSQAAYYEELLDKARQLYTDTDTKSRAQKAKANSNIMMALRKAAIHPLLARRIYNDKRIDKMQAVLQRNEEFGSNRPDQIRAYLTGEAAQSVKGGDFALHKFCTTLDYMQKFELKKQEWMDSGKVKKFQELVTAYVANGDRILVFSQFTTLMDILEAVLETMAVQFMRLDGSTNMNVRQDMIDKFYEETNISVFMLSTRAGGAGINLACANRVIIFDSGFNPQDDIQAENRAHRVGQTREVEVVRLVTKGTIEEQIHALGESKLALDERVAGEGATAADEKQAEKQGEQMVEKMFLESLRTKKEEKPDSTDDLKDAFKAGMEGAGVKVASKQAKY